MSPDWDDFIARHGVGEYVRARYIEALRNRASLPKWERDDLAENIRRFGPSKYVARLRKRMTNYVQGGGVSSEIDERAGSSASHGPHRSPGGSGYERPPEPHKFPCEDPYCDRCNEAIKRIFRDCRLLPSGKPNRLDLTDEPFSGRLKVPSRWRKDESDK